MDFRFLSKKQIEKFFTDTGFSVGQIIRAITREDISGVKIENRAEISSKSDQEWYEIIEKAFEDERE